MRKSGAKPYLDDGIIEVDRNKVLQILVNLISNAKNASQATSRPKKIIVRIQRPRTGGIQVQVIDNGIGIPPENLAQIFNHGFTTRVKGHGFGLHSAGPEKEATFVLEFLEFTSESALKGPHPQPEH